MPFYKYPLVPIAIFYIFGIILAKYINSQLILVVFALFISLVIYWNVAQRENSNGKKNPVEVIFISSKILLFYFIVLLLGYIFYKLSNYCNLFPACEGLKDYIRNIINYNVPYGNESNLFAGLFLGERQAVSREIIDVMRNTNTMHVLAISGDHIAFIGIIIVSALRLLLFPRKISALIALLFVIIYVSMVGWQPPTFRAAVMFTVFAVSWAIDRPVNTFNSLAFAALVILIINPDSLFQASFQLSFTIVLGLLLTMPYIKFQPGLFGYVKIGLIGSTVAWLVCLPLTAYYFKVISPISIIANLVMVPGISLVLAIGFVSILCGSFFMGLSGIFNIVNYFLVKYLLGFLKIISGLPFSYYPIQGFSVLQIFLSYLVIGIVLFSLLQKRDSVLKYPNT